MKLFTGQSAGGLLKIATVTLTGAQLAAINGAPVTAIAAQGAGKAVQFANKGPIQFTEGTAPYVTYGSLLLDLLYGVSNQSFSGVRSGTDIAGYLGTDNYDTGGVNGSDGNNTNASDYANRSIIISSSGSSSGRVTASNVSNPGSLYAPGDQFTLTDGGADAVGIVDTVDGGGGVLTYHLTAQGTGYTVSNGRVTSPDTGIGTSLEIDVTAIQSVSGGDGTLTLTIPYIVVALQ